MVRGFLNAKIRDISITGTYLEYEGSITLDEDYMERAGILPYEEVHVLNVETGARFTTYAIKGNRGGGAVDSFAPADQLNARQAAGKFIAQSVKIRSDADVVDADEFYHMVDMFRNIPHISVWNDVTFFVRPGEADRFVVGRFQVMFGDVAPDFGGDAQVRLMDAVDEEFRAEVHVDDAPIGCQGADQVIAHIAFISRGEEPA